MFNHFFDKAVEFQNLQENIQLGIMPTAVFGIEKSAFIYHILAFSETGRKQVVVLENESEVQQVKEDLMAFNVPVYTLPRLEIAFFNAYSHSHQVENERLEAIYALLEDQNCIVLTTPDAMLHAMSPKDYYLQMPFEIAIDDELPIDTLTQTLVQYGFEHVDVVEAMGQFTKRGGIVDVFVPRSPNPCRIEFFGDAVDSMRLFDVQTQLSKQSIESIKLRPCREGLLSQAQFERGLKRLKDRSERVTDLNQKQLYKSFHEQLETGSAFDASYKLLPLLAPELSNLFDYLGNTLLLSWSFNRLAERVAGKLEDWQERFKDHLTQGEAVSEHSQLYMTKELWFSGMQKCQHITFTGLKTQISHLKFQSLVDYHIREANAYQGQLAMAVEDIQHWLNKRYRIWIMVEGDEKAQGMIQWLTESQIPCGILNMHSKKPIADGQVQIIPKGFSQGFSSDSFKAIVLTERELFGSTRVARKRPVKNAKMIKAFTDLSLGDFVVHETHGIGQYQGVHQLKVDGQKKDFLKIIYKGDDALYVPVEKMNNLQKYIGHDVMKVRMNRMGSGEWKLTKAKAKKAVADMTDELLALYGEREQKVGYGFSRDSEWQKQFEEAFPYQETPDQLRCIDEIKRDMELAKPMDRLLCGDVGYGKTEVAMRAIFKAVNDSKQVAILVPTTILAQQHYNTMMHRFSTYPVKVGVLSRFRTKKEIDAIIDGLRTGVYDVVVGTHRLLSKDVRFKDLGLLVVDEEQRFGVKHKEKIKQLKTNVDVLTLSATPIPRTLHMSLVGVRDMSLIQDPPEDRYPIQTYVLDFQEAAIREAILRELDRKGQVYFVHNRVEDIDQVTAKLAAIVPEAKIVYAHGQMNEHQLEQVMLDFMEGHYDVLVSTTIIETGLDISNVNTIVINQSDRFGLSQLYQLRGRVGRSNRMAYAYLTYEKQKVLSEVAEKRLRAIKEFTDLGSGFKIAMRDLELRGAGNLLGAQQHGHLASVGYEMFCKLLEETVREAKGEVVEEAVDTSIEIACEAYIPEYYIGDSRFKIELYKRISAIRHIEDRRQIQDDLFDLYGTLPQSVDNLITVGYLRALAMQFGFEKVVVKEQNVNLLYSLNTKVNPLLISLVLEKYNSKEIKFVASELSRIELILGKNVKDPVVVLHHTAVLLERFDEARRTLDLNRTNNLH